MKRKNLFFVAAFFVLQFGASAAAVTLQDAQTVALNFFKLTAGDGHSRVPLTATLQYTRTETDSTVDFYVFNMSPVKGFVIVSATDNDGPIIGYSTESVFPNDFSKIGLNEWLIRWSEELHYVALHNVIASPTAAVKWADYRNGIAPVTEKSGGIGPLCQTAWDQATEYSSGPALYNNDCPSSEGSQAVTGCVATAMAQIMKYWNYPVTGTGSSYYYDDQSYGFTENYGELSFDYGTTTFQWADMPDSLTPYSSTTQIDAIGTLMYACGVSVDMNYSPDESGAYVLISDSPYEDSASAQYSFYNYFGYQNIMTGLMEGSSFGEIPAAAFTDSVESELNAGRVVELEGADQTYGGHTWVCDGYNTSNMLHMNWGWSGIADGFYSLTNMDPDDEGLDLDFSEYIEALTHIQPPPTIHIGETATVGSSTVCKGAGTTLTASTHTNATYSWSPTTGLSCSTCASTDVTPTESTTYTVTADSSGYIATASVTVNVDAAIVPGAGSTTDVSCYGGSNGSTSITATGGAGGFGYLWSNGKTTANISDLSAGFYQVTITDADGCTATAQRAISQPLQLTGSIATTNTSCGLSNGKATVTPNGGTSGYDYVWNNGQTTGTISNLAADSYIVTITDANHCTATASGTVTASENNLSVTFTATNVTCYGSATGSVTADVTGGSGLSYLWSNGSTTVNIANVPAGTYTLTVSASSDCSTTASQTVTQPASAVTITLTSQKPSCTQADGSVSASVAGGTSGYDYVWNSAQTTATISNLAAGTYTVTVTDANHCTATASEALTPLNNNLSVTLTATNVNCHGSATGSVTANVTGGSGLSYLWSNGSTTLNIADVPAGTYTLTVSTGLDCSTTASQTVSQPASAVSITLTPQNPTCNLANGTVSASVTGGTSGYDYVWNTAQTIATISNLAAGTYTLTVTDANHCTATASDALTAQDNNLSLTLTATNVACYASATGSVTADITGGSGLSYLWSNGSTTVNIANVPAGTYTLTISAGSDCSVTASQTVSQPASGVTITLTPQNPTCNQADGSVSASVTGGTSGYNYLWNTGATGSSISDKGAGTYSLTVTDHNGCTAANSSTLTGSSPFSLNPLTETASCYGESTGTATVTAANGTGTYNYVWSNGGTTGTISNLAAGPYNVTVSDNGSCSATGSITVNQLAEIIVTTSVSNCTGNLDNGSATVTNVSGAGSSYTYEWNNGDKSKTIANLAPGAYQVTITAQNGCEADTSLIVGITTATGINDITNPVAFALYPNPAANDVVVSLTKPGAETTLDIRNILGQQLVFQTLTGNQTHINVSGLTNGVYLVELRQGDATAVRQLVVSR